MWEGRVEGGKNVREGRGKCRKNVVYLRQSERRFGKMKRNALTELEKWKKSGLRKPLVLKGARQVGKTWLMKEFGRVCYRDFAYFNFDEEPDLAGIFEANKNPAKIVETLAMVSGKAIVPGETLILFDEIQECPAALNSLKHFREQANEHHIVAAGSLLGTLLAQPKSYPVGMVNLMRISPMTFDEFLEAEDPALYAYYSGIAAGGAIEEIFHGRLMRAYHMYLAIGGMPESVSVWLETKDPREVSRVQGELIEVYENDFSKHNGRVNAGRLLMVFRSIVSQLAKPNGKFMYGAVREGARARDFEEAIEWLTSAGMLNRVHNVSKIEHPLAAFDRPDHFKLYLFDTGLLKHMARLDNQAIALGGNYQFKGPLAENYVVQQLQGRGDAVLRYYSDKHCEIDLLVQSGLEVTPVEIKAGEDKSAASFKRHVAEAKPRMAVRFSARNYRTDGAITNLPLYLAPRLWDFLGGR